MSKTRRGLGKGHSGAAGSTRKRRGLLGEEVRRLQPKLRMIANGSELVNVLRAELSASVKVARRKILKDIPLCRGVTAHALTKGEFEKIHRRDLPRRAECHEACDWQVALPGSIER